MKDKNISNCQIFLEILFIVQKLMVELSSGFSSLFFLSFCCIYPTLSLPKKYSEFYLPESQKTISSTDVGGIAGGSKYVCSQIFFKFALDSQV